MTCKDCLHYEACKSLLEAMGYTVDGDGENADERCDTFADRSRYVVREKGEWIPLGQRTYGGGRRYTHCCNRCGQHGYDDYALCPNCGADMRKGENG